MATASEDKPFQFTLWHLAVATFWLGVILALATQMGEVGVILAFIVICSLIAYYAQMMRPATVIKTALSLMVAIMLWGWVLWPGVSTPRWAWHRSACRNNLSQIGIALHNYHDTYGSFPPAYIADDSGRPMHSWRVLLLPFLQEPALEILYNQYDFSEPWDGPQNRKLAAEIVRVYSCPGDKTANPFATNYFAVVGPNTAWPGELSVKTSQITDGTSHTILIVEMRNSGVHWMEPRDLDVTQMSIAINPQQGPGLSSEHPTGALVLFADGHVRSLTADLDPQTLRAMLTMAAGDDATVP